MLVEELDLIIDKQAYYRGFLMKTKRAAGKCPPLHNTAVNWNNGGDLL
jgi:hypothetical protein